MNEKLNNDPAQYDDPNLQTEFFRVGALQEYYESKYEYLDPELGNRALRNIVEMKVAE